MMACMAANVLEVPASILGLSLRAAATLVGMTREWFRGSCCISTAPERLDIDVVHGFLVRSYWAAGRTRECVERSIAGSLPFGLYHRDGASDSTQVGFARVVTDRATVAYLCDVFVLEPWRGRGLGVWLVESVLSLPELAHVRWLLGTQDAHELYRKFGFEEAPPGRMMRRDPR
jgi:GNAT superfamily N-acetyltransferase